MKIFWIITIVLGILAMRPTAWAGPEELVRIGYVIPSNRSAQPDGVSRLQNTMSGIQDWYAKQIELAAGHADAIEIIELLKISEKHTHSSYLKAWIGHKTASLACHVLRKND